MRVSLKWLREYVDINVSPEELAEKLTLSGLAVEGIHRPGEGIIKVCTGKITDISPHPNADKLVICQVSTGEENIVQIVTGATNIKTGDVVPVALEGAKLAGDLVIKKTKLRGVESRGMLCSGQELGLDPSIMSPEQAQGIMILDSQLPLGLDIINALGLDDVIFDLELTPNRGDCLSMVGVAREVAVLLKQELKMPEIISSENFDDITDVSVDIVDADLCKRYTAKLFTNVKVCPSPGWMQDRLRAAGIRPISNIVDITNYVMLEMGQPLHAFDYDKLVEGKLIVRRAKSEENLISLDGCDRKLSEDMLVIADPGGAVAVAGVMGGLDTEVTETTNRVLLESAYFDPISIRRTSKTLGLRSESSSRFEKGIDITSCERAAHRAATLLLEIGAGEVKAGTVDNYPGDKIKQTVILRPKRLNYVLGVEVPREEVVDILTRLQFRVNDNGEQLLVSVPGHRADVSIEEDLIEEVARIYGYDKIPNTLPCGSSTYGNRTEAQALEATVKDCLSSLGLYEIVTYSFTNPSFVQKMQISKDSPLASLIQVQNPLSEDQSVMRTVLLPGLLETLSRNANRREVDLAVFELGKVFLSSKLQQLSEEKPILSIAAMGGTVSGWNSPGKAFDFYYLKGIMEILFKKISLVNYSFVRETENATFHPGKAAKIIIKDKAAGVLGQLHPDVIENYHLPKDVVALEVDLSVLLEAAGQPIKYSPLPKYPGIERDLALVASNDLAVQDIVEIIKKTGGQYLKEVNVFDVYRGKQVKEGHQSIAFSLSFGAQDRTLTDQEINQTLKSVAEALEKEFGVELRS